MDSFELTELLQDRTEKQFWLKPMGIPDTPIGDHPEAANEMVRADFAKNPSDIQIGDILFAYRIGISRLLYMSQVVTEPKEATPDEIAKETWRDRWRWGISGRNLTPLFGADWRRNDLAPFALAREYNALHPKDEQKLGPIQHGRDKHKISKGFSEFIIRRIIDL
jgi:hypothetical protein